MKRVLPALLIAAALAVGLLLPSIVLGLQEHRSRDEEPDIRQVNLSVSSGLSFAEKLRLLAEDSQVSHIGLGRNQNAESLSNASWALFTELRQSYRLFEYETLTQTSQQALLISGGSGAFVCWEVCFEDDIGSRLRLLIDDETALPLSMRLALSFESEGIEMEDAAIVTLYAMLGSSDLTVNTFYSSDVAAKEPEILLRAEIIDAQTGELFLLPISYTTTGFRINAAHLP